MSEQTVEELVALLATRTQELETAQNEAQENWQSVKRLTQERDDLRKKNHTMASERDKAKSDVEALQARHAAEMTARGEALRLYRGEFADMTKRAEAAEQDVQRLTQERDEAREEVERLARINTENAKRGSTVTTSSPSSRRGPSPHREPKVRRRRRFSVARGRAEAIPAWGSTAATD